MINDDSSFEKVLNASDNEGGVEAFVTAIKFKKSVFEEALKVSNLASLDKETFLGLCAFKIGQISVTLEIRLQSTVIS